jgi:hypothetical protein
MGLIFNRRKRIAKGTNLNVSTSGASISKRAGRLTVNSRGKATLRIAKGIRFRF